MMDIWLNNQEDTDNAAAANDNDITISFCSEFNQ